MKKHIKITPIDFHNVQDRKIAKLMEIVANSHWDEYGQIIIAITSVRNFILNSYGIDIEDQHWNRIMEEVVRMRMKLMQK